MRRSEFDFDLPEELIAQYPLPQRGGSRLLHLDSGKGALRDRRFGDLPQLLRRGDLLVFNNTRVLPARLYARKDSGGRVEIMVERVLDPRRLRVQLRASRAPRPGSSLHVSDETRFEVLDREGEFFHLRLRGEDTLERVLQRHGHMPLPPYILRDDEPLDSERYQTVYARVPGAVAAPTAGLHFDAALLATLDDLGVECAFVTLHVGAGTFQPVRVENIHEHRMHSEYLEVDARTCEQVRAARARGGRVIAVGTTAVRCLETAAQDGEIRPFRGDTDIFITPGYAFQSVDALVTNFHMPESTLIMLVCAFGGREAVLAAYRHAVTQRYRFFSYGDAMLITR